MTTDACACRYSDNLLIKLLEANCPEKFGRKVMHGGDETNPVEHAVQVKWVDDWYGTSCDAATAAEASEERAEQLCAFEDDYIFGRRLGKTATGQISALRGHGSYRGALLAKFLTSSNYLWPQKVEDEDHAIEAENQHFCQRIAEKVQSAY